MKRIIFIGIGFMLVFNSCVKKQIKKDEVKNPGEQTFQSENISTQTIKTSENVSTQTIKTDDILTDQTNEANVRVSTISSLDTVNFDFDKYELTDTAREILSKNAKIILENNYQVTIEGHCDERGTTQYNLSLGQKRANVVKEYYIKLGIDEKKIGTVSYGKEMPLCKEHTEECWAKNRRAETKVVKQENSR